MKTYIKNILMSAAICTVLAGCELTEVQNPNITDDVYLTTSNISTTWVTGLRRQLALTLNQVIVNTELVSDNYFNNRTSSNKVFDIPQIDSYDIDVNAIQGAVQRLREMSEYGLNKVIPADATTTPVQKAEMLFMNAYAHMLSGELFTGLPGASTGPVLTPAAHYGLALTALDQAIALQTVATEKSAYILIKARIYYYLGDITKAKESAAIAMTNTLLLKQATYDGNNSASNAFQGFVFSSSNDFAPLPRLDFLDPKYYFTTTALVDQKPVSYIKSEEAYLITAEAQVAENNLSGSRITLKSLLSDVVSKRAVFSLSDKAETRNGGNRNDYPLTAVKVKFDASDVERDGYVLNRQTANITVYTVSGTKVTAADVDNAVTQDALLYVVYRMRQEIFIGEGRRMTDLGIKFPVSQTEQLNNPNVTAADIKAQIPSFIPLNRGMDDFTNDKSTGIVTMRFDMNKILVTNKTAKEIFPFIN